MAVPGTGSTNQSLTFAAAKKLAGKAHTSNLKEIYNETIPSNVQINTSTIFGQAIPQSASTTTLYARFSASVNDPVTVEYVEFVVSSIDGTTYDANTGSFGDVGFGGGDEAQASGPHGYTLSLPSYYESSSSFSGAGTGSFVNGQAINETNGAVQLINPSFGPQTGNKYGLSLFTNHPASGGLQIPTTSPIEWAIDYFNGVIFVQDYIASAVPTYARGFIYIGKFSDTMITEASSSGGGGGLSNVVEDTTPQLGGDLDVNGNDIISVSDGNIKLMPDGDGKVIIDGDGSTSGISIDNGAIHMRNGGAVSEIRMYCEVNNAHYVRFAAPPHAQFSGNPDFVLPPNEGTNGQVLKTDGNGNTSWTDAVSYGRTAVTSTITASVNSRILGVSGAAAIDIRLPPAGNYASGQTFIIKDESGGADVKNITIRASGSQTIDGQSLIVLESPFAAVNLYSDGTSKFFIY